MDAEYRKKIKLTVSDIQFILDGNIDRLHRTFMWNETKQGWDFWNNQVEKSKLSDEGRKALEEMLK